MSAQIFFYQQKISSEDIAERFGAEKLHKAMITLLEGEDLEGDDKLKELCFLGIEDPFDISVNEPGLEDFFKNKENFLSPDTSFMLLKPENWAIIKKIIEKKIKDEKDKDEVKNLEQKLTQLEAIFSKNSLVINTI